MNTMTKDKTVFVGVSGGVDSSVSAALLKEEGYNVVGVFIKTWQPEWIECTWQTEKRDAIRVCAHLDIPFIFLDLEKEYKQGVADYMISEYRKGRTPNPDVMCNKEVKFGAFLRFALENGADYVATGHYAQVFEKNGLHELHMGKDTEKDQSYFLWTLTQHELKHTLFPVGHLEKPDVRKLAEKYGLPTAAKKDSQGICFIGKVDMHEFLSHYIEGKEGNIVSVSGEVLGTHKGVTFYTIGQRHGFEVSKKGTDDSPLYVVRKDMERNTITVSEDPFVFKADDSATVLILESVNWISSTPSDTKTYGARIRYRQKLQECHVTGGEQIIFTDAQSGVSKGQSVVVYEDTLCLGGGIIL